jgi:LuxR family maltose regulon positive regulatory protein
MCWPCRHYCTLHDVSGDEAVALGALERAITLAEPSGMIRPFLDAGPSTAGLLVRLVRRKTSAGYVGQLLAAFRDEERSKGQDGCGGQTPPPPPGSAQSLVEPLTSRESDVLALLTQRLSDKEIAEKLFLSPATVKRYTVHIYQKLGVTSNHQQIVGRSCGRAVSGARRRR